MNNIRKFLDFIKRIHENTETAPAPTIKPRIAPATRPAQPKVVPMPKNNAPAVKPAPVITPAKPRIKPATRPSQPKVTPLPKNKFEAAISLLLCRYNYLLRRKKNRVTEQLGMDGETMGLDGNKGISQSKVDDMRSRRGGLHTNPMVGMQANMDAMQSMEKIKELEKDKDKTELIAIAKQIVESKFPKNPFGIDISDITWDLQIGDFSPEELSKDTQPTRSSKNINNYDEYTKNAIDKRRIANSLTQGFAMKMGGDFFDPAVEQIVDKLEPELLKAYMEMADLVDKNASMLPEPVIQMMLNQMSEDPTSSVRIEFNNGEPTIVCRSINMLMLVHEMVKGVYELMSLHGLQYDEKTLAVVYAEADNLYDEMIGFKYGPEMVDMFKTFFNDLEQTLLDEGVISEPNPSMLPSLLAAMYTQEHMDDATFLAVMRDIFDADANENAVEKVRDLYLALVQPEDEQEEDYNDVDISSLGLDTQEDINDTQEEYEHKDDKLDRLLDKISEHGYSSLTPDEHKFLDDMHKGESRRFRK